MLTVGDQTRRVRMPDDEVGVVVRFASGHFRLQSTTGEILEHLEVTPVWLNSGEIRFYRAGVLTPIRTGD